MDFPLIENSTVGILNDSHIVHYCNASHRKRWLASVYSQLTTLRAARDHESLFHPGIIDYSQHVLASLLGINTLTSLRGSCTFASFHILYYLLTFLYIFDYLFIYFAISFIASSAISQNLVLSI
jgi:hypothetical protein